MSEAQRTFSIWVIRTLRAAGFTALWAGGCVRDQLLGRSPKDYDVATAAHPDQVLELFRKHRVRALPIGVSFGVVALVGPRGAGTVEVATFREDASYSDGRHPDAIQFSTPQRDAQRRDFTINGLFFDPIEEKTLDFVGGKADLAAGVLRAIREPTERFEEDKLRMLRAVRFATSLDFQIEPATFAAIQTMASQIHCVSAERITAEMTRILTGPNRGLGLRLLAQSGLGREILPEFFEPLAHEPTLLDRWTHRLERLESPDVSLAMATWAYGLLTPNTLDQIAKRWKWSNVQRLRAVWTLRQIETLDSAAQKVSTLQPLLIASDCDALLQLRRLLAQTNELPAALPSRIHEMLAWSSERLDPSPLLDGDTLLANGFRPGILLKRILQTVRDAQLDERITTVEQALALASQIAHAEKPDSNAS